MTERVAPLSLSILTVAAWALSLAVFAGRPELFVVALPLLVTLAALGLRPSIPDYGLTHVISGDPVFEGDTVTVTVAVTARSAIPLMELVEPLTPEPSLAPARQRSVLALQAGQTVQWRYEVRCGGRGRFELGACLVRTWDGLGLRAWERSHNEPQRVRVYPTILPLRTLPRPLRTQMSIGDHVSRDLGEGIEPGDIREFAPGDRIKQVNWRASLRLGRLYVTQHHRERNADVVLMLDTLAEVGRAPATTLDLAVRAAASLAAAYLARKDRVGLINYGGLIHWVKPGTGRVQYERLADALLGAAVVFTYVAKDLALVPPRVLPPNALVIALTSLLDRRFARAIIDLAGRGFDLVTLVVSPVDVTRASLPPSPRTDLACRLWALERRAQLDDLRRRGLLVLEWHPSQPLELALATVGRRRPRLVAAG
ncbi:MAG: DUF58 domain-containing protein [Candidatus Rokuibacteriota bacterium]